MGRIGLVLLAAAFVVSLSLLPPSSPALHGLVLGPDGPIADAIVRYQGTSIETRSDPVGRFTLPPLAGNRRVTASRDGFLIGGTSRHLIRLSPLLADDGFYVTLAPKPNTPAGTPSGARIRFSTFSSPRPADEPTLFPH